MKEVLPQMIQWAAEGKTFAMARVIRTWGSSPRPVGSALLISSQGMMVGSVSGGCVEGSVVREATNVIATKAAKKLAFGVSDDEAWSVGLACGGKIEVYLQYYPTEKTLVWDHVQQWLTERKPFTLITALLEGESESALIDEMGNAFGSDFSPEIINHAKDAFTRRANETVMLNEVEYFIQVFPVRRKLLLIGAAHITSDLIRLANSYDFETIVIDPRGAFVHNTVFDVTPDKIYERYPSEILGDLPLNSDTYAVILSHDPKIDDDALKILLRKPVAYIGALGSKKTHEKRVTRLRESGFSNEEIARIESPIGLDIHAIGANEIALSIMASLIKAKNEF